ncbi:MAG TPA: DNA-processing protein DprA, partial [Burkholderiaceae bacterium]
MDGDERAGWLRLVLTPDLPPRAARELLREFGLPGAIFGSGIAHARLARVAGDAAAQRLAGDPPPQTRSSIAEAEQWLASDPAHALVTLADPDYPAPLLDLSDPPLVLFARGRRVLLRRPAIAIVGSRSATRQGEGNASAFAAHLARAGLTIVSGMARGVDAAAHRGALETDAGTIAVLGTGIDIVYPPSNRELATD